MKTAFMKADIFVNGRDELGEKRYGRQRNSETFMLIFQ